MKLMFQLGSAPMKSKRESAMTENFVTLYGMKDSVYVVFGTAGKWSDRDEWPIAYHLHEEDAKAHVTAATKRANELFADKEALDAAEEEANSYATSQLPPSPRWGDYNQSPERMDKLLELNNEWSKRFDTVKRAYKETMPEKFNVYDLDMSRDWPTTYYYMEVTKV